MKSPTDAMSPTDATDFSSDERGGETVEGADGGAEVKKVPFRPAERLTGLLLGCAIGDALGMPVEGVENEDTLRALHRLGGIRDFLAPQSHVLRTLRKLRPGCWTDDTQLTLSLARSVITAGRLD